MDYLLNQLINGICQGAIYALMAIGYSVIVGVTGMVTFTYGDILVMGAFAAFYVFEFACSNILLGIAAAFAACWLLGLIVYKTCYERFLNAPRYITMICTFGFGIGIRNLAQIVFGENKKPMLNIISNKLIDLGPAQITLIQIVILVTVIVLSVLLSIVFSKTKIGVALRAVSQDKTAAYVVGVNVKKYARIGSCIGCSLGGVAGLLLSIYYQTVYATMGGSLGMKAFASSVLGGLTDVRLSALGGVCIGVIENLGITFSSASFRDIFAFVFLMLVLFIRPQGFAKKKGGRP